MMGTCAVCGNMLWLAHGGTKVRQVGDLFEVRCSTCNTALPKGLRGVPIASASARADH